MTITPFILNKYIKCEKDKNRLMLTCSCGRTERKNIDYLDNWQNLSCQYCSVKNKNYEQAKKKIGTTIKRLKCIDIVGVDKGPKYVYLWQCDCGNTTQARYNNVVGRLANTYSCGCLKSEQIAKKHDKPFLDLAKNQLYHSKNSDAKKRQLDFNLPIEYFFKKIQQNCYYCNAEPKSSYRRKNTPKYKNLVFKYNGLDRVDNSKGYIIGNVVACCNECNTFKRGYSQKEIEEKSKLIIDGLIRFNKI